MQGSTATLIYVLVTYTNIRYKVATHNDELWQRLYVFIQTVGERLHWFVVTYRISLLQHLYALQGINHWVINITIF
jgi:phosphorylcholine metabolism protein LicD